MKGNFSPWFGFEQPSPETDNQHATNELQDMIFYFIIYRKMLWFMVTSEQYKQSN